MTLRMAAVNNKLYRVTTGPLEVSEDRGKTWREIIKSAPIDASVSNWVSSLKPTSHYAIDALQDEATKILGAIAPKFGLKL